MNFVALWVADSVSQTVFYLLTALMSPFEALTDTRIFITHSHNMNAWNVKNNSISNISVVQCAITK